MRLWGAAAGAGAGGGDAAGLRHEHDEVYATLDNLLCYVADWYGNNGSCVFGLIDRAGAKLWVWKFDSTQVYDAWGIDL